MKTLFILVILLRKSNYIEIVRFGGKINQRGDWMSNNQKDLLTVSITYAIFGTAWILLSDNLVLSIYPDIDDFIYFSTIKGLVFVLLSVIVIVITLNNQHNKRKAIESKLVKNKEQVKLFKAQSQAQREVLLKLIEDMPIPVVLHREDKQIVKVSKSFSEVTGYTQDEIPNLKVWVDKAYKNDKDDHLSQIIKMYDATGRVYEGTFTVYDKSGNPLRLEWYSTPIGKDENGLKNVISVAINLTKFDRREKELKDLTYHDDLTHLYNRRYYNEKKSFYAKDAHIGLMLADINGLKLMNDVFGHLAGDKVIIRFAELLTKHLPKDSIICRVGGDEFTAILPNYDERFIQEAIHAIKKDLKQEKITDIEPSASFGYAEKVEHEELDQTFFRAENMLYKEKVHEYDFHTNYMIQSILHSVFENSDESPDHIKRMLSLSKKLKSKLHLSKQEEKDLDVLINLHDIGKIAINKNIFKTGRPLSVDERKEINKHPEYGYRIANALPQLKTIAYAILTHHENVDGTGYPFGLKNDEIPLIARVLRIIDSYETMISERHYKAPIAKKDAIAELQKYANIYYDEQILEQFLDTLYE